MIASEARSASLINADALPTAVIPSAQTADTPGSDLATLATRVGPSAASPSVPPTLPSASDDPDLLSHHSAATMATVISPPTGPAPTPSDDVLPSAEDMAAQANTPQPREDLSSIADQTAAHRNRAQQHAAGGGGARPSRRQPVIVAGLLVLGVGLGVGVGLGIAGGLNAHGDDQKQPPLSEEPITPDDPAVLAAARVSEAIEGGDLGHACDFSDSSDQ